MSRRGALRAGAVAGALVLLVGLGAWQLIDSSSTTAVCGLYGEEADVVVYLAPLDTPEIAIEEEQRSIEEEVAHVRGVDSVELADQAASWNGLVDAAETAGVDVTSRSVPVDFPASLAVTLTDAGWAEVERVLEDLTEAPIGSRVVLARDEPGGPFHEAVPERWDGVDMAVFLDPDAPLGSLEVMASELADAEGVEGVESFTQEQAFDEFAELFADSPELVSTVSPELLPASVRVTMTDPADVDRTESLAESVQEKSQVRDVVLPLSASLFDLEPFSEFADAC
jgi:cell division protein FtsX